MHIHVVRDNKNFSCIFTNSFDNGNAKICETIKNNEQFKEHKLTLIIVVKGEYSMVQDSVETQGHILWFRLRLAKLKRLSKQTNSSSGLWT